MNQYNRNQAKLVYTHHKRIFGKTRAEARAIRMIDRLLSGTHPAFEGSVFTPFDLIYAVHMFNGINRQSGDNFKSDANDFFGIMPQFPEYLKDSISSEGYPQKLNDILDICLLYLASINKYEAIGYAIPSVYILLYAPKRYKRDRAFTKDDMMFAIRNYANGIKDVPFRYRHRITDFFRPEGHFYEFLPPQIKEDQESEV